MSRISLLWAREIGDCRPQNYRKAEESQRFYEYQLSDNCHIESVHSGGVNSLNLDATENRYLLAGSSDKLIAIYDTWNDSRKASYVIKQIAVIGRPQHSRFCHKFSIICVQWYPHDNAIFTSSSTDRTLKIWDSNALGPAETFSFKHIISSHAMSSVATAHNLIAVATADCPVFICDMRTGSNSQELRGHRKGVVTVKWSPRDEYQLVSGSEDNKILLWDVRQARGQLKSFDQHNGRDTRAKKSVASAHSGHVNGLCFSNDGLFLLSTGTDNRLRLWNTDTGENTLTNYGRVENSFRRQVQMAFSGDSSVAFVPTDRPLLVLNVHDGTTTKKLTAHFNSPTCCEFNPNTQEMYSGGQDNNILVWGAPLAPIGDEREPTSPGRAKGSKTTNTGAGSTTTAAVNLTADTWSDDDSDA